MALGALLSGFAARVFGTSSAETAAVEPDLVSMGVEAVVDAVDPRLRAHSGYAKRLAPGIARTIAHLRKLGELLPVPLAVSRSAWADDALLNAFFATAADVPAVLGRSEALRAFFGVPENWALTEAYALLGMLKTERQVFAPAIVDGMLRHDVAQTTVSFSQHRLLAVAADFPACRREVGVLILRRLAAIVLARITSLEEKKVELSQRKALLAARLRGLRLRENGLQELAVGAADRAAEIAALERELETTVDDYMDAAATLASLEKRLDHVDAVFGSPVEHVDLARIELRVNRLGYKVAAASGEPSSLLTLSELSIGEGLKAVIAFARCPRAELPPRQSLHTQALF